MGYKKYVTPNRGKPDDALLQVSRLQDYTGLGIYDCINALSDHDNDFDKALAFLNQVIHRDENGYIAPNPVILEGPLCEGHIEMYLDETIGAMVEVNCITKETSMTQRFRRFVKDVVLHIAMNKPYDLNMLYDLPYFATGATIGQALDHLQNEMGEHMTIRRYEFFEKGK
jgi:elongation factor Ts